MRYLGSCLCKKITYEITGPLKFIAHDHCSICRKATGAGFVTWCGVKSEQDSFKLLSGSESLTAFKSTPQAQRQFCKHCGTHLFFRSTHWPGEIHFTRASIDSQLDERPKAHVYFSDKAEWIDINDDLPKYGGVSGLEPLK